MINNISPEMIKLLNSGDKKELHAFLKLYARPIYERALAITGNDADAKRVTRRAITETALLAAKGALEDDVDVQLMSLTDACCSEDIFFEKLVDDTMNELGTTVAAPAKPLQTANTANTANTAQDAAQGSAPTAVYAPEKSGDTLFEDSFADMRARGGEKYTGNEVPDLFDESDGEDDGLEDDDDVKKPGPLLVLLIFLLALITVALVWVLLVKLMYIGFIPKFDFGFAQWFNANVFMLY